MEKSSFDSFKNEADKKIPEETPSATPRKMSKAATVALGTLMAATAFKAEGQTPALRAARAAAHNAHFGIHTPPRKLPPYKAGHKYPSIERESSDGTEVPVKESELFGAPSEVRIVEDTVDIVDPVTGVHRTRYEGREVIHTYGPEIEENTGNSQEFVNNNTRRFYDWLKDKKNWLDYKPEDWDKVLTNWNLITAVMYEVAAYEQGGGGTINTPPHFAEVDGSIKGHGTNINEYALYETQFAYDLNIELDGLVKELTFNPNNQQYLHSYMEKTSAMFTEFYREHPTGLPHKEVLYVTAMANDIMVKIQMLVKRGINLSDYQDAPGITIEKLEKALKYVAPERVVK